MTSICLRVVCIAGLAAALACETPAPPSPPPAEAVAKPEAPPVPSTPVTTAPRVDLETLPAREDFEEQAEAEITPANLEKQLEALEKEVSAE
jgi:hypothetical protein